MKRYKLLKDLPTFKAGDMFYISEHGALVHDDGGFGVIAYARQTLDMFPDILTEWFEEIQEPTDSIHWKPNNGDEYWYTDDCGGIYRDRWDDESIHVLRYSLGLIKRTKEECKQARNRRLAEIRLRRTSNFKPDFEHGNGGWSVYYNYRVKSLHCVRQAYSDSGELVHYETEEDAKKSIKENREDWLIYFGIKEEK